MVLLILFCTAFCAYLFWSWNNRSRCTNLPPVIPGKLPIVGHAFKLAGNTQDFFNAVKKLSHETTKQGGVSTLFIATWPMYFITDPDDLSTVAKTCLQKEVHYNFAKPWLGDGLLTAPVSIWKHHRKLLNPTFNRQLIEGYQNVFNSHSEQLVKNLEAEVGKGLFDHSHYLKQSSLEIICATVMGITDEKDTIKRNHSYADASQMLMNLFIQRFQKFWLHNDYSYYWSKNKNKQDKLVKIVHNLSDTVIRKKKAEINAAIGYCKTEKKFMSVTELLLELSIDDALTDKEIRDEVNTMIVTGFDTTASQLTLILSVLGSYPEVQERIYNELKDVFDESEREIEKQDLSKLVYTEAAVMETIRLFPIVPIVLRDTDRDLPLTNYTIPAKSSCVLCIYQVNRHPIWGPDAEVFRPERWLDPSTLPDNPNAFASFSLGRRNCIGKTFAISALKTTLAYILRKYRITSDIGNMELKLDVVLRPVSGHYISIEKR